MLMSALRRLFRPAPSEARAPEGAVVYAIGDVHGSAALLSELLAAIGADARPPEARAVLVLLGDYVDRGAQSREVLDILIESAGDRGFDHHFLRGNHDQAALEFMHDPSTGPAWCAYGGRETLRSYGVEPPPDDASAAKWRAASRAFGKAVPLGHLSFLRGLEYFCVLGDYMFVHAGVRPGVALEAQSDDDLMRIREPFLSDPRRLAKVIVHGHTPETAVHSDQRRIGLDTGACFKGVLSAVRLEGPNRRFLQVSAAAHA